MTKRKKEATNNDGPSFHPGFLEPTASERRSALGGFPIGETVHAARHRRAMLSRAQKHLVESKFPLSGLSLLDSMSDLDDPKLYQPAGKRSMTTMSVPKPREEQDWLACYPEEGQTFDQYVKFQSTKSGKFRKIANVGLEDIVLLPIVRSSVSGKTWPRHGVPLEPLVSLTEAFFHRPVRLFPPAILNDDDLLIIGQQSTSHGSKVRVKMQFPGLSDVQQVAGRIMDTNNHPRLQLDLRDILFGLKLYRENTSIPAADGGIPLPESSFCVTAITMDDLYSAKTDLFVSGMAYGGDKVAVFSFSRYHPHIKMASNHWYDYGYGENADDYSYYEEDHINGKGGKRQTSNPMTRDPPKFDDMNCEAKTEFYRRCSKILVHELMHLYGLGHCIFNRCIMMGTGHLVEDFQSPFHLCPVCLRKLQWRLGFDVVERYKRLAVACKYLDLEKEAKWIEKQVEALILQKE